MKSFYLSGVLVFVLLIIFSTQLGNTVFAEALPETSIGLDFTISGMDWTGTGSYKGISWIASSKTLTLTNANIYGLDTTSEDSYGIKVPGGTVVVLEGSNTITSGSSEKANAYGLYCANGELTFKGSGKLIVTGGSSLAKGKNSCGVFLNSGELAISDSTILATGGSKALGSLGSSIGINATKVTVNSGSIIGTGGSAYNSFGILSDRLNLNKGIFIARSGSNQEKVTSKACSIITFYKSSDMVNLTGSTNGNFVVYGETNKYKVTTNHLDFSNSQDQGNLDTNGYQWINSSKTLTIKNLIINTSNYQAVKLPANSIIEVEGINILKSGDAVGFKNNQTYGIYGEGNLTIQGYGNLTSIGGTGNDYSSSYGISAMGIVNISNVKLTAIGGAANPSSRSCGLESKYKSDAGVVLRISSGDLTAIGGPAGAYSDGIKISDGNNGGKFAISGGSLIAIGGTITPAPSQSYTTYSNGISSQDGAIISGGNITAIGGIGPGPSSGISINPGQGHIKITKASIIAIGKVEGINGKLMTNDDTVSLASPNINGSNLETYNPIKSDLYKYIMVNEEPSYIGSINLKKDGLLWTASGKTITLQQTSEMPINTAEKDGEFTANLKRGVWKVLVDGLDSGKTIEINNSEESQDINFYTVSFTVTNQDGSGSRISATYDQLEIATETPLLEGKRLVLKVEEIEGNTYSYLWSGLGTNRETSKELVIENLSSRVSATLNIEIGDLEPIVDEDENVISGASIKLMKGQKEIASTKTDKEGKFVIEGVSSGRYNLVISKDDIIVTKLIVVSNSNLASGTINLSKSKKNSLIEIRGSSSSDIVVGGLNEQFDNEYAEDRCKGITELDNMVVTSGGSIEVKLVIGEENENRSEILSKASLDDKTIGMLLDLAAIKTLKDRDGLEITSQSAILVELPSMIEVYIPLSLDLQGKSNYLVYSYKDGDISEISTIANKEGERIELVDSNKTIKLRIKKLSTYSVAFSRLEIPELSPSPEETKPNRNRSSRNRKLTPKMSIEQINGGKIEINTDGKEIDIIPDDGYVIGDVIIDGNRIGAREKYRFTDDKDHKIEAVFVKSSEIPYYIQDGEKVYIGFSEIKGNIYRFILPINKTVGFKENTKSFKDNTIAWAKESIDFVTEREIFLGTSEDSFCPNDPMTRAMLVTVIGRLYERSYGIKTGANLLTDVDKDVYYAKYLVWAKENSIIKGIGDNIFATNDKVTREEIAAMMLNLAQLLKDVNIKDDPLLYADAASISPWGLDGVKYCQDTKIITGKGNLVFAPKENATRAEVAVIIERFIKAMGE